MPKLHRAILATVVCLAASIGACNRSPAGPDRVQSSGGTTVTSATPNVSLAITSFSVIEYQYPDDPIWYYAPQVEVHETSGTGSATVVLMNVSIPGLTGTPPYKAIKCVAAGQRLSLLHEVYGDYEYVIFGQQARATGGTATAELTYTDSLGKQAVATGSGPIVPGSPPSTYTGGPVNWSCLGAGRE